MLKVFKGDENNSYKKVEADLAATNFEVFAEGIVKYQDVESALNSVPAVRTANWLGYHINFDNSRITCKSLKVQFSK